MKTKDMIRVNSHLICAVCAFLATWATVRACGISTFHLFGGLLFVIYLLLVRQFRQWSKTAAASALHKIVSAALAALFVFFYLCADYEALLGGLSSRLFRLGHLIIIGAGLFCIFYVMLFCFL